MDKNTVKKDLIRFFITLALVLMTQNLMAQRSLYSDVKAHQVGDVITVVLTENIRGSSSSDSRQNSSREGSSSNSFDGSILPSSATFGANSSVEFSTDERVSANQRQLLTGTLSVRIEDVEPGGNFLISGNRSMEISGELYQMSLTGYIRGTDINDANEILSYRIANADIVYYSEEGKFADERKKNRKLIWIILGAITGAAAAMGT